jgi:hypothetical protein
MYRYMGTGRLTGAGRLRAPHDRPALFSEIDLQYDRTSCVLVYSSLEYYIVHVCRVRPGKGFSCAAEMA